MISITENLPRRYLYEKEICGCELAITNKAKCIQCGKKIAKGTPRLWIMGELRKAPPDEGIEKIKRFMCHSCSASLISSKENSYNNNIIIGEKAKKELIKQNAIKQTYYNFLKDEEVNKKVINEELIQELENEEDNNDFEVAVL